MYRRILVGCVEGEPGREALDLGTALASASGAELLIAPASSYDDKALAEKARGEAADLVVLSATDRGPVGRVVPGTTVERLLGDPPCAVAVAPPHFGDAEGAEGGRWVPLRGDSLDVGMRVVGVGYDGSAASLEALRTAVELAIPNGAALRVYSVAPLTPNMPGTPPAHGVGSVASETETLRAGLYAAVATLPAQARALPVFLRGFVADELVKATAIGVDLLVLGSRRGGPVRRLLHHSVTSVVMRGASCPILILPEGVGAPAPSYAST